MIRWGPQWKARGPREKMRKYSPRLYFLSTGLYQETYFTEADNNIYHGYRAVKVAQTGIIMETNSAPLQCYHTDAVESSITAVQWCGNERQLVPQKTFKNGALSKKNMPASDVTLAAKKF